jgi:hypothetical protein
MNEQRIWNEIKQHLTDEEQRQQMVLIRGEYPYYNSIWSVGERVFNVMTYNCKMTITECK